jgi:hypothetical protein
MSGEMEKQPEDKAKPRRWERKGGAIGFVVGLGLGLILNIPQISALFGAEDTARKLGEVCGGLVCPSFAGGILGAIIGWFVGKVARKP